MTSTFNNGSKDECTKSSCEKADEEFLNAINFAFTSKTNYFLFIKAICIKSANLIPSHLFMLTLDYYSAICKDNITMLIVWIYSPAGISNPKKTENYSSLRNESPYSCKQYPIYFKGITKNIWCLFSIHFTPDSITKKPNAIYNINRGELVRK